MGSRKKTISYRYDAVRNRVGMTDPDGGRFTYSYDSVNRIKEVVNPQGDRTTYGYDPGGRRTVKKLANGTRASFSYDAASNLTRLANLKSDGTTISSFDYDYDKVGNRTAVLEADGSRVTWSYDATYQLTGEHRTGSNAYRDTYTYDPAGNRLLKIHDGARTSYSYDAANQLQWSEDASGRTTYAFDADGNQELVIEPSGDRTTTAWDYENRTTLVQLPSGIRNTMAYDPDGLRVKLEESAGTKKFVWDEQNYLAETDENDDTQVVYTNEPRLYGNLVSQRRGSDSHWYYFDAIGSTRELTDASESVTDTRLYDAWGVPSVATGPTILLFQFCGKLGYATDLDTNIAYVRQRHLTPDNGRWMCVDPRWAPVIRDRFVYASNSPVLILDPSGERAVASVEYKVYEMTIEPPRTANTVIAEVTLTLDATYDRCHTVCGPVYHCPVPLCFCVGDIDISLEFDWHALTDGFQHTLGSGRGTNPLPSYDIGMLVGDEWIPLRWTGNLDDDGRRIARDSHYRGTAHLGQVPCAGPQTALGRVGVFGGQNFRQYIDAVREDLGSNQARDTYGYFTISYDFASWGHSPKPLTDLDRPPRGCGDVLIAEVNMSVTSGGAVAWPPTSKRLEEIDRWPPRIDIGYSDEHIN
ncbi:MAG: RHS repeat protein [Planctomycetota bacterium]|nr:MAG: RHS repeat protein [Planctomycetota bacterium]REK21692.1 MAG: RHS repeat protein [Planctomycetota bacterium]REK32747.1 MAG: RHS repeat protein [Planctomycetota bacterium]